MMYIFQSSAQEKLSPKASSIDLVKVDLHCKLISPLHREPYHCKWLNHRQLVSKGNIKYLKTTLEFFFLSKKLRCFY